MNERVIWTHPKGRFEVVERTYRALDGRLGRVRECRFTLRRDVRGLACNVAAQPISVEPALCVPQKGVHGPVTAADVDTWCKWYRQGKSVADISEMAGRNEKTVTAKLKKRGVLLTDEEQRKIRSLAAQGWTVNKYAGEICDEYCKFPYELDYEALVDKCEQCPMVRLKELGGEV